jgi:hypothetical protein
VIHATTDSEKSGYALHVCHCDQSVTVNDETCGLIQGIERIAELNRGGKKQFSLLINSFIIPADAGIPPPSNRLRLVPE